MLQKLKDMFERLRGRTPARRDGHEAGARDRSIKNVDRNASQAGVNAQSDADINAAKMDSPAEQGGQG